MRVCAKLDEVLLYQAADRSPLQRSVSVCVVRMIGTKSKYEAQKRRVKIVEQSSPSIYKVLHIYNLNSRWHKLVRKSPAHFANDQIGRKLNAIQRLIEVHSKHEDL